MNCHVTPCQGLRYRNRITMVLISNGFSFFYWDIKPATTGKAHQMSTLLLKLTSNASLRGMVSPDGMQVFSVYDFISLACQKTDGGAYARKTYSNLVKVGRESRDEIVSQIYCLQFPGGRGAATPTTTIQGLSKLMTMLGNKVSKAFKLEAFDILERYLDGDLSMCTEIEENKAMGSSKSHQQFVNKVLKRAEAMEEAEEMPAMGYVYATSSSAFPGLLKIGKTVDVPRRVAQLNTSCAPAPHIVVAVAPSFDYSRDEAAAHRHFAKQRREGEFFQVSGDEVKEYFQSISAKFQLEMSQNLTSMVGQTFLTV